MELSNYQIELLRELKPNEPMVEPLNLTEHERKERVALVRANFVKRGYLKPNTREYCIMIEPQGIAFLENYDKTEREKKNKSFKENLSLFLSAVAVIISAIALYKSF